MLSATTALPASLHANGARPGGFTAAAAYTPGSAPYTPSEIRTAYGVNRIQFPDGNSGYVTGNGAGQTIAIVDAYTDPDIAKDLATFDKAFGLSAPPSFTVLNENGGTDLSNIALSGSSSWALEESIDVEWSHAIAPAANIVLYEAYSNSFFDLDTADQTAANPATYAALGLPAAGVVSDSWYAPEGPDPNTQETQSEEQYEDATFYGPISAAGNVTVLACTGDIGTQSWPSVSPYVMAVGGTSLYMKAGPFGTSYTGETGWSIYSDPYNPTGYEGTGGGTSLYEAEPSFQTAYGINDTGGFRATPDVSMDASSSTPLYFEDSFDFPYSPPISAYCYGTSCATPMWAALLTITNQGRALNGEGPLANAQEAVYQLSPSDFHDVTSGYNVLATAGPGYDEVTGIGTPIAYKVVEDLVNVQTGQVTIPGSAGADAASAALTNPAAEGSTSKSLASTPSLAIETANNSVVVSALSGTNPEFHSIAAKSVGFTLVTSAISSASSGECSENVALAGLPVHGSASLEGFHSGTDAAIPQEGEAATSDSVQSAAGPADIQTLKAEHDTVLTPSVYRSADTTSVSNAAFAEYEISTVNDSATAANSAIIEGEGSRPADYAMLAGLALALGGSWSTAARPEEVRKSPALRS
jgi:subtilase family serine protease